MASTLMNLSALCPFEILQLLKKRYLFKKSQVYVYSSVPGTVDKTGMEETFGLVLVIPQCCDTVGRVGLLRVPV